MWRLLSVIVFWFSVGTATAQEVKVQGETKDTTSLKQPHSPKKATLLSAVLPGAGQIYNKKYWKVPIIYGAFGTCAYFAVQNRQEYLRYRDAYRLETDGDSTTVSEFANFPITVNGIREWRDRYKQWMELNYILMGLTYVLNILDANVDAHLFYFNVNDDLSLRWQPQFGRLPRMRAPTAGISIQLNLNYK